MKRAVAAALLLLLGAACRSLPPARPGTVLPLDDPWALALLSSWVEGAAARDGLRGRARLAVDSADGDISVRSKQVLVAQRPAQLRVEVLGILNQSVAVVVTDGHQFEVFRTHDRSYRTGAVGPDLLWDEARIALTPREAIEVLLGVPLPEPGWSPASVLRMADGEIRIDFADASGVLRQRVGFDPDGLLRAAERFDTATRTAWRVRFDDYRDIAGSAFAHSIELDVSVGDTHAEIALRDIELNPPLSDDIFRLERSDTPASLRVDDREGG